MRMSTVPAVPRLKRVPPGVWIVLAWCASMVYADFITWGPNLAWSPHFYNMWNLLVIGTVLIAAAAWQLQRRPVTAHTLVVGGAVTGALTMNSTAIAFTQFTAVAVALIWIAGSRPRRTSLAALAVTLAVLAAYGIARELADWPVVFSTQIAVALAAVVMWFVGDTSRQTREHARDVGAHATAEAAANERLRIARELHDMIAHTVGVIALQAGAASMLIDAEPAKAREAVGAIESTSRETLSGLRRMLVSLRNQDSDSQGSAPMPRLADVERLAAATTAAGVRVEVEWRGERRALSAEIELAAFRIVQESVTNVVRHAGVDRCRVVVGFGYEGLTIEVTDDGTGALLGGGGATRPGGSGYGLIGIRERVTLSGGVFEAGPRLEGGYRVWAHLPARPMEGD
jgi:signal transduction histidine kinase